MNDERSRVTYHAERDYGDNFKDPEEIVRAAYFVELVMIEDWEEGVSRMTVTQIQQKTRF